MDRLTGLEVLVAIVDHGGFGKAAERLGLSPTMVSTHLARLEDRLGAQLVYRSTRRFALTVQGHRYLEQARAILDSFRQAENLVGQGDRGAVGRVAIDAPSAIGLRFVVPAIPAFRAAHPRVALDLSVGDRSTMFLPEGFDVLVRVGAPPEGKGEVIPLGQTRLVQIASPDYLNRRGAPVTPDDLHDHDCILYTTVERPVGQWRFTRGGEKRAFRPGSVVSFNHGDAIAAAVIAGVGIGQTLDMLVRPELASGKLTKILTEWNQEPVAVQLFIPGDRVKRPAVRAAAEFLRDRIDWSGEDRVAI